MFNGRDVLGRVVSNSPSGWGHGAYHRDHVFAEALMIASGTRPDDMKRCGTTSGVSRTSLLPKLDEISDWGSVRSYAWSGPAGTRLERLGCRQN